MSSPTPSSDVVPVSLEQVWRASLSAVGQSALASQVLPRLSRTVSKYLSVPTFTENTAREALKLLYEATPTNLTSALPGLIRGLLNALKPDARMALISVLEPTMLQAVLQFHFERTQEGLRENRFQGVVLEGQEVNLTDSQRLCLVLPPCWVPFAAMRSWSTDSTAPSFQEVNALFEALCRARLLTRYGKGDDSVYVVPADIRADELKRFLALKPKEEGSTRLSRQQEMLVEMTRMARAMYSSEGANLTLPPTLERWAKLLSYKPKSEQGVETLKRAKAQIQEDQAAKIARVPRFDGEEEAALFSLRCAISLEELVQGELTKIPESKTGLDNPKTEDAVASASRWLDTARPVADLLRGYSDFLVENAIQRCLRKLQLLRRREADKRWLDSFFPRAEYQKEFEEFFKSSDDDPQWALHFIGAGGVGKTMLLRNLQVNTFDERSAACARIDFDYLSADFPSIAPGILLMMFMEELSAYDDTPGSSAVSCFQAAREELDVLERRLRDEAAGPSGLSRSGRLATQEPEFERAVGAFIRGCRSLETMRDGKKRRILLLIDTCEELSRIRPDDTVPENVVEAFRILRALREGPETLSEKPTDTRGAKSAIPVGARDTGSNPVSNTGLKSLRVVFSGRSPLASAGAGWRCDSSKLPERPYLRLRQMRGFTQAEARLFLEDQNTRNKGPELTEGMCKAVLQQSSPDSGPFTFITLTSTASEGPLPSEPERYNPLDLKFFIDWFGVEPALSPETVSLGGAGQFVRLRILDRLKNDLLKALMPLLARLGVFDDDLLRALLAGSGRANQDALEEELQRLIGALLAQEDWLTSRTGSPLQLGNAPRTVFQISKDMRRRLLAYFEQEKTPLPEPYAERAVRYLRDRTENASQHGGLEWTDYLATLRLLEGAEEQAAAWWTIVDRRLRGEQAASITVKILSDLLGNDTEEAEWRQRYQGGGATGPSETDIRASYTRLRAGLCATYAAALRQQHPHPDPKMQEALWREVQVRADEYPDPSEGERLRLRAIAGRTAALARSSMEDNANTAKVASAAQEFWETLAGAAQIETIEMAASLIAAAEALVEYTARLADSLAAEEERFQKSPWYQEGRANMLRLLGAGTSVNPEPIDSGTGPGRLATLFYRMRRQWEREASSTTTEATTEELQSQGVAPFPAARLRILELTVHIAALAGHAATLLDRGSSATRWFSKGVQLLQMAPASAWQVHALSGRSRWVDWTPPRNVPARFYLLHLLALAPSFPSPRHAADLVPPWLLQQATKENDEDYDLDLERLLSRHMDLSGRDSPIAEGVLLKLYSVRAAASLASPRSPECWAHSVIPPLSIQYAEAAANGGAVTPGLEILRGATRIVSRDSHTVTRPALRALLKVVRRMRLRDAKCDQDATFPGETTGEEYQLLQSLEGLAGATLASRRDPEWYGVSNSSDGQGSVSLSLVCLHALWRSLWFQEESDARQWLAWFADNASRKAALRQMTAYAPDWPTARAGASRYSAAIATWLDLIERDLIDREVRTAAPPNPLDSDVYKPLTSPEEDTDGQSIALPPEVELALLARELALRSDKRTGRNGSLPAPIKQEMEARLKERIAQVGRRRAGEILLDEGEMLALRLPGEPARFLLHRALEAFLACGDHVGAVLASILLTSCFGPNPPGGLRDERTHLLERLRAEWDELREEIRRTPWQTTRTGANEMVGATQAGATILPPVQLPPMEEATVTESSAELPPWNLLVAIARNPTAEALDKLGSPEWRPWLVRLLLILIDAQPPATSRDSKLATVMQRTTIVRRWIAGHYGTTLSAPQGTADHIMLLPRLLRTSDAVGLPAEFARWLKSPLVFPDDDLDYRKRLLLLFAPSRPKLLAAAIACFIALTVFVLSITNPSFVRNFSVVQRPAELIASLRNDDLTGDINTEFWVLATCIVFNLIVFSLLRWMRQKRRPWWVPVLFGTASAWYLLLEVGAGMFVLLSESNITHDSLVMVLFVFTIFMVLWAGGAGLIDLLRRTVLRRLSRLVLTITPIQPSAKGSPTTSSNGSDVQLRLQAYGLGLRLHVLPLYGRHRLLGAETLEAVGALRYKYFAGKMPRRFTQAIKRIGRKWRAFHPEIVIEAPAAVHGPCWEALATEPPEQTGKGLKSGSWSRFVLRSSARNAREPGFPFAFRRVVPGAAESRAAQLQPGPLHILGLAHNDLQAYLATLWEPDVYLPSYWHFHGPLLLSVGVALNMLPVTIVLSLSEGTNPYISGGALLGLSLSLFLLVRGIEVYRQRKESKNPVPLTSATHLTALPQTQKLMTEGQVGEPLYVLHLVGNAVETATGVHLRLVGGHTANPTQTVAPVVELRAEDVAHTVSNIGLCVLQGVSLSSPQNVNLSVSGNVPFGRIETDRREVALLRVFAAQLYAQGIPAVVVVPPLPLRLTKGVFTLLRRRLQYGRPNRSALAETLADIQRYLVRGAATTPDKDKRPQKDAAAPPVARGEEATLPPILDEVIGDELWEAALDISLFAPNAWRLPFLRPRRISVKEKGRAFKPEKGITK